MRSSICWALLVAGASFAALPPAAEARQGPAAVKDLEDAVRLHDTPEARYRLALALEDQLRLQEAMVQYKHARLGKAKVSAALASEIELRASELESRLPRLIQVTVHAPSGAAISIDGHDLGYAPIHPVDLDDGLHRFELLAPGAKPFVRELPATSVIELKPADEQQDGRVEITSTPPGVAVKVDGRTVGHAPLTLALTPGPHVLGGSSPGYASERVDLFLEPGQTKSVPILLFPEHGQAGPSPPFYRRWPFWAGVGGAVVTTALIILVTRPEDEGPLPGSLGMQSGRVP